MTDPRRPRWFRFSLQTLLITIMLVASSILLWQHGSIWVLKRTLRGHTEGITSLSFSPDGQKILSASQDKSVRLWDIKDGLPISVLHTDESLGFRKAVFSSDGLRIFAADSHVIQIWDIRNSRRDTFENPLYSYCSVSMSPSCSQVVVADFDVARVLDASNGTVQLQLRGHTNGILSATFSPDGNRILTASNDKTARIWDAKSGSLLLTLSGHQESVCDAAFSADGNRIITASQDNTARVFEANSDKPLFVYKLHTSRVVQCAFFPDSRHVVTASWDGTARIWDSSTGAEFSILQDKIYRGYSIEAIAVSPDGGQIATGNQLGIINLWIRQRPDGAYGVTWLWEFWITLSLLCAVLWSIWRDKAST